MRGGRARILPLKVSRQASENIRTGSYLFSTTSFGCPSPMFKWRQMQITATISQFAPAAREREVAGGGFLLWPAKVSHRGGDRGVYGTEKKKIHASTHEASSGGGVIRSSGPDPPLRERDHARSCNFLGIGISQLYGTATAYDDGWMDGCLDHNTCMHAHRF